MTTPEKVRAHVRTRLFRFTAHAPRSSTTVTWHSTTVWTLLIDGTFKHCWFFKETGDLYSCYYTVCALFIITCTDYYFIMLFCNVHVFSSYNCSSCVLMSLRQIDHCQVSIIISCCQNMILYYIEFTYSYSVSRKYKYALITNYMFLNQCSVVERKLNSLISITNTCTIHSKLF